MRLGGLFVPRENHLYGGPGLRHACRKAQGNFHFAPGFGTTLQIRCSCTMGSRRSLSDARTRQRTVGSGTGTAREGTVGSGTVGSGTVGSASAVLGSGAPNFVSGRRGPLGLSSR